MELRSECLKHFLPILMRGETAAGREADHVSGIELSVTWLANPLISCGEEMGLHVQRRKSMAPRAQGDTNTIIKRIRRTVCARILTLI